MIRINETRRDVVTPDSVVNHENIFLAKMQDSESATRACRRPQRLASASCTHCARDERVTKSTAAQAFPSILTFANAGGARVFRFASHVPHDVVERSAARALSLLRQHFLKRDAVFFDVLVYSEWSAFRFPNARSD
jgi:hypothetical protein